MSNASPNRVLLVDEDPDALAAMQQAVTSPSEDWHLVFAGGLAAAREALERERFDVLVLGLPARQADATAFLREVRDRYPRVVRLAMSDNSSRHAVVQSLDTIHRHLGKPGEPTMLRGAIRQAHAHAQLLASDAVRNLVNRLSSVPTPDVVLSQVIAEMHSPAASSVSVAGLISEDPALTAQLLRLVNSPVFSLAREITSAFTAVTLLGFNTVGALCLGSRVFGSVDERTLRRAGLSSLFSHSLRVGQLARVITLEVGGDEDDAGTAFAAGVLHDVGKLVLATNFKRAYEQVALVPMNARRVEETRVFGSGHDRVGGYLLSLWGVPLPVVEAVAFHHDPSHHEASGFTPLTAVHVANAMDLASEGRDDVAAWPPQGLDEPHLAQVGLPAEHPIWQGIVREIASENRAAS